MSKEKRSYEVRDSLNHDGEDFAIGATVDLHDEHAEPLLKSGVIAESGTEPAAKPAAKPAPKTSRKK